MRAKLVQVISLLAPPILCWGVYASAQETTMLHLKDGPYFGEWESCRYDYDGRLLLNTKSVGDWKFDVHHEIDGSPVFDGFPYPSSYTVTFKIEVNPTSGKAFIKYKYPRVLGSWLLGDKEVTLGGDMKVSDSREQRFLVKDEELELRLVIKGKILSGIYEYDSMFGDDAGIFYAAQAGAVDDRQTFNCDHGNK